MYFTFLCISFLTSNHLERCVLDILTFVCLCLWKEKLLKSKQNQSY